MSVRQPGGGGTGCLRKTGHQTDHRMCQPSIELPSVMPDGVAVAVITARCAAASLR